MKPKIKTATYYIDSKRKITVSKPKAKPISLLPLCYSPHIPAKRKRLAYLNCSNLWFATGQTFTWPK